jgi:16S rRNA (cytidine1402-2'-O)-methyltransferase
MSRRALETLAAVDVVAAEDTRHSRRLLTHFGISRPLLSLHEHNETARTESLLQRLLSGESVALICDAGTPLISDPGYRVVVAAHREGVTVSPVPGPCSPVAALCVSGLPTDRFAFEGFPPAKQKARQARLKALALETRTLVFLESSRRIKATMEDLVQVFGAGRDAFVGRELTKLHESLYSGPLGELVDSLRADPYAEQGEYVVVVGGMQEAVSDATEARAVELLQVLLDELPPARAAAVTARLCGCSKKIAYRLALELNKIGTAPCGSD